MKLTDADIKRMIKSGQIGANEVDLSDVSVSEEATDKRVLAAIQSLRTELAAIRSAVERPYPEAGDNSEVVGKLVVLTDVMGQLTQALRPVDYDLTPVRENGEIVVVKARVIR